MIYKNGIKVNKIELVTKDEIICHLHLSNGKVWSWKPKKIDPAILYNKGKLEVFCVSVIGLAFKALNMEMEK